MTVAPVPDLIVDVMAAADPAAQRVAATRLERLSSAADGNFAATIDGKIEAGRIEAADAALRGGGASPVRVPGGTVSSSPPSNVS